VARVLFKNGDQSPFLQKLKLISGLDIDKLSLLCGVSSKTFRDWMRGKYSISEKSLLILIREFFLSLPDNVEIVDDYWYVSKSAKSGGLKRLALYGPPGTLEGRRKGGINSQIKRKENPEFYRLLGCNLRKKFKINKPSIEFAEAAGIILGDGAITKNQLRISISSLVDRPYAFFVTNLFYKTFKEKPTLGERLECNTLTLTISGINLIKELQRFGFKQGDKVRNQVDFPSWVWSDIEFQKACVRGLMDTDGGCYFHKHKSNGLFYRNFGMCFTNKSLPLVRSVAKVLMSFGLKFSLVNGGTQIYIYSFEEIKKYFALIGSNNPKNMEKFNSYLIEKTHRIFL
jgi:hypothetical protein